MPTLQEENWVSEANNLLKATQQNVTKCIWKRQHSSHWVTTFCTIKLNYTYTLENKTKRKKKHFYCPWKYQTTAIFLFIARAFHTFNKYYVCTSSTGRYLLFCNQHRIRAELDSRPLTNVSLTCMSPKIERILSWDFQYHQLYSSKGLHFPNMME